eukprot:GGOE01007266.1.p1 GENE.GGOE01007266.1~~GGOE01007266.1.p1  ORF type:complete len:464 (-),score=122.67 GGOE01007266.1:374-1765(-)
MVTLIRIEGHRFGTEVPAKGQVPTRALSLPVLGKGSQANVFDCAIGGPKANCERLPFLVHHSEGSGKTIKALRDALLALAWWQLDADLEALENTNSLNRFKSCHLVLGGRDHMDCLIREWRDNSARWGRMTHDLNKLDLGELEAFVLFNYYNGKEELTVKSNMARNLKKELQRPWDLTPVTFIIKPGSDKDERERFRVEAMTFRERGERLWIVKPARLNRAIGIKVMRDVGAILQEIDGQEEPGEWVVQKYIERPLLIHGRKFDIRTWAVLGPKFDVWLYREGVMRTSSELYTPSDLDNILSHLTNHCLQEKGPNFCKFEPENLMRYGQFQAFLDEVHPGCDFRQDIVPRMKDVVFTCFQSVKTYLIRSCCNSRHALLCYQVFGFDFLIDENLQAWLLEINGQPWVAEELRPKFTEDLIELVINPIFQPPGWAPRPHDFEPVEPCRNLFRRRPTVASSTATIR